MKGLLRSFAFAFRGIIAAVRSERNLRIHLTAAVYVAAFSFFYKFTRTEYAVLVLTFSSVIACELINTAIEKTVDICSPEKSCAAGFAKDAAAGAVLVTAVFAVIVGVLLFGDAAVIKNIFAYYASHPLALAGLICSIAASAAFVFYSPRKKSEGEGK